LLHELAGAVDAADKTVFGGGMAGEAGEALAKARDARAELARDTGPIGRKMRLGLDEPAGTVDPLQIILVRRTAPVSGDDLREEFLQTADLQERGRKAGLICGTQDAFEPLVPQIDGMQAMDGTTIVEQPKLPPLIKDGTNKTQKARHPLGAFIRIVNVLEVGKKDDQISRHYPVLATIGIRIRPLPLQEVSNGVGPEHSRRTERDILPQAKTTVSNMPERGSSRVLKSECWSPFRHGSNLTRSIKKHKFLSMTSILFCNFRRRMPAMTTTISPLTSLKIELDARPESFGELRRSDDIINDPTAQRARFAEDGYLYIPGFFPRSEVAAARADFINCLENLGGLHPDHAADEAIPSGTAVDYSPPIRDQTKSPSVRKVVFGSRLLDFYKGFFGEDVAHFDHIWVRVVNPGHGTPPHADSVYMNRGSKKLMTAWIPYGDVSRKLGGLMLLEKSHKQADRLRHYLDDDVDTFCENRGPYKFKSGWLSNNPASLREKLGGRWLTANFRMGDLLTFGMETVHGSLDNHDTCFRMSTDTRYQPAAEEIDPRWVGSDIVEYGERNRIGKIC